MLKRELNRILINEKKIPQRQGEVKLFRTLIKAMKTRYFVYEAKEVHSSSDGKVEHKLIFPHVQPSDRCCEIADVLMIFTDERGNMRYTFLQNKRDKKTAYTPARPLNKVSANPVQWDLLHHCSPLSNALKSKLPLNCLSSAVLSSVATYGIFVNDANAATVDMSYNIAKDLEPKSLSPIGARRAGKRTYDVTTNYNKVNFVNGYFEIEGTTTLDDFELAAQAMLVGTPLERSNGRHRELAELFLSYANTCLIRSENYGQEFNLQTYRSLIRRCADAYEANLQKETILPFNLTVIRAKKKYYATQYPCDKAYRCYLNKEICCGFEAIYDRKELYEKMEDDDSIVFIDSCLLDDANVCMHCNTHNCYIVERRRKEIKLFSAYNYFNF